MSEEIQEIIAEIITAARKAGVTFADVRYTEATGTAIVVQDGRADKMGVAHVRGAGVRVLLDGAWGFAPTNNPTAAELRQCLEDALRMARAAAAAVTDPASIIEVEPVEATVHTPLQLDPREVPLPERVAAVYELERLAASRPRIVNSIGRYADAIGRTILANTIGTYIESFGGRCQIALHVTASDGVQRQTASKSRAGRGGFELIRALDPEEFAGQTADKALALLKARPAPAGKFTVIIDPLICGLLVHEAFGHNCEADAIWSGNSILEGKLGQPVAAPCVTIVDDPTWPGLNGSYEYDHEGVPAQRHVLVEKGVLRGYLHSLETAGRLRMAPNGAARAQSHQDVPIVRMSNTYIAAGEATFEELLHEVREGLYLAGGGWGHVFTAGGQFTCQAEQAFRIEKGRLTTPYRNVCLSGMTLETLQNVIAVGREIKFELGGTCEKEGQAVPVDCGGPHVAIRDVVVGGMEA